MFISKEFPFSSVQPLQFSTSILENLYMVLISFTRKKQIKDFIGIAHVIFRVKNKNAHIIERLE
jgi:hypothetical protein